MTLLEIQQIRDTARAAYLKAFNAQNYTVNPGGGSSRSLSRQALRELHEKFLYWQTEFEKAESGQVGMRTVYGTSID